MSNLLVAWYAVALASGVSGVDPSKVAWSHTAQRRTHGPGFAVSCDGQALAFAIDRELVEIRIQGARISTRRFWCDGNVFNEIAYSPDGTRLAASEYGGSDPARIFLFDRSLRPAVTCHLDVDGNRMMFSRDSRYFYLDFSPNVDSGTPCDQTVWSVKAGRQVGERKANAFDPKIVNLPSVGGITVRRADDRLHLTAGRVSLQKGKGLFHQTFGPSHPTRSAVTTTPASASGTPQPAASAHTSPQQETAWRSRRASTGASL